MSFGFILVAYFKVKKTLFISAFIILLLLIVSQLYRLASISTHEKAVSAQPVADFEFETMNGEQFTNYDLPEGKPIVFMYLDPNCEDCENMVKKIVKYYAEFKSVRLYLITEASNEQLGAFWKKYELARFPNIIALFDRKEVMFRTFQLFSVPSFLVFDKHMNIVKVIDGKFNFSIVVKYTREARESKSSKKKS